MKIVVGIGNPGKKYAATRHNIGFVIVDQMAERCGMTTWRKRFHALSAEGIVGHERCLLIKPETYMNESGRAVRAAVDWHRTDLQNVLVVCDDFNLPLGRLRVRGSGSSGGHNGLASIAAHLDSEAVARLRVGIGSVTAEVARDFVLSGFAADEKEMVGEAIERAVDALDVWLKFGLERCQNQFNARLVVDTETENKDEEAEV